MPEQTITKIYDCPCCKNPAKGTFSANDDTEPIATTCYYCGYNYNKANFFDRSAHGGHGVISYLCKSNGYNFTYCIKDENGDSKDTYNPETDILILDSYYDKDGNEHIIRGNKNQNMYDTFKKPNSVENIAVSDAVRTYYENRDWSDDKKKICDDTIDYLTRLKNTVVSIRSGKAETTSCRDNDIDPRAFRHYLLSEKLGFKSSIKDLNPESSADARYILSHFMTWQEMLARDVIVSSEHNTYDIANVPYDINETVDLLLEEELSEKEKRIIIAYYRDNESLEDISKRENLTRSRIQQIKNHTVFKKLHRQDCMDRLKHGNTVYKKAKDYRDNLRLENDKAKILSMQNNIDKMYKENDINALKDIYSQLKTIFEQPAINDDAPLISLNLSARTHNALMRGGYTTIKSLQNVRLSTLVLLNNFGKACCLELISLIDKKRVGIIKDIGPDYDISYIKKKNRA